MPSKGISTAGMRLMWGVSSYGSLPNPTDIDKTVPEVKTMPSFNPTPGTIDITPLQETEFILYTQGLKDMGGALEFGANLTNDLVDMWESVVSAYNALTSSQAVWFAIVHPKLENAIYFQGTPIPLGLNDASVNSALETTLYVTPNSAPTMAVKPSFISETTSTSAYIDVAWMNASGNPKISNISFNFDAAHAPTSVHSKNIAIYCATHDGQKYIYLDMTSLTYLSGTANANEWRNMAILGDVYDRDSSTRTLYTSKDKGAVSVYFDQYSNCSFFYDLTSSAFDPPAETEQAMTGVQYGTMTFHF